MQLYNQTLLKILIFLHNTAEKGQKFCKVLDKSHNFDKSAYFEYNKVNIYIANISHNA
jgi:hypothetical protein